MRSFLGVTLVSALAILGSPLHALAQAEQSRAGLEAFSRDLQTVLNARGASSFEGVAVSELQPALNQRYERFLQDFPEVTWWVEPADPWADGRETLRLRVRGVGESEGLFYQLEATERIAIRLEDGRMVDQELVSHEAMLRSGERHLEVTIGIPDAVLTGSRYEVDLIVEEPLGQALVAAGLINHPTASKDQLRPNLRLALQCGGLFKVVRAPQEPGFQTWALMLVHPEALVTVTKRVCGEQPYSCCLCSNDAALRHRHRHIPARSDWIPFAPPAL